MTTIVAVPYNVDASSFCFSSAEVFDKKQAKHFCRYGSPVEEYWFDLIDGENAVFEFNSVFSLDQCNLQQWFEYLERYFLLSDCEQVAFNWLVENRKGIENAFDSVQDVCVIESSIDDYAYDLVNEMEGLSEFAKMYFDYEALARDMEINGEIIECGDYLITNPQCI